MRRNREVLFGGVGLLLLGSTMAAARTPVLSTFLVLQTSPVLLDLALSDQEPRHPPPPAGPPPGRPPWAEDGKPPGGPPGPPGAGWLALLPRIEERRPELAERIRGLHTLAPRRFEGVMFEGLLLHLEQIVGEAEHALAAAPTDTQPEPPEPPGPGPHGPGHARPGPPPLPPELRGRQAELERQHQELERRSQELARMAREQQERQPDAPQVEALRNELRQAINAQFAVRTELRKLELERIERELRMLQGALERTQRDLERRARQQADIAERRLRQLLGGDPSDW